jgi:hypothetical protein
MPIKSFTFAFKLDAKDLLAYVVEKNVQVDIQATGSKRQAEPEVQALPATQPMLALPAPHPLAGERKTNCGRIGSKAVVLFHLAQHGRATAAQLKAALVDAGYQPHTLNNLIWSLKNEGLVSRSSQGYRILNKGLRKLDAAEEAE